MPSVLDNKRIDEVNHRRKIVDKNTNSIVMLHEWSKCAQNSRKNVRFSAEMSHRGNFIHIDNDCVSHNRIRNASDT